MRGTLTCRSKPPRFPKVNDPAPISLPNASFIVYLPDFSARTLSAPVSPLTSRAHPLMETVSPGL